MRNMLDGRLCCTALALALAAGWAAGCAADPPAGGLGTVSEAIHNGLPDVNHVFSAVVRTSSCSGTLIAPNVIVTSAHCVPDLDGQPYTIYFHNARDVAGAGELQEAGAPSGPGAPGR